MNNPTSFDYFQLEREYADALKRWQKDIELKIILKAKLEVAKKALEWYSNPRIPVDFGDPDGCKAVDISKVAREALEAIK